MARTPLATSREATEAEFDRLAPIEDACGFDDSVHCYPWLLAQLPPRVGAAAEVGCGTGTFTALLAPRARHVLAMDVSREMLARARSRCAAWPQVELAHADAHEWEPPPRALDLVVSIGALHHLDGEALLPRWAAALAPGGLLLILDAIEERGARHLLSRLYSGAQRWRATGRWRPDPAVAAAWATHARFGGPPTWSEAHTLAHTLSPPARIRRHLPWRYSLAWRAPA